MDTEHTTRQAVVTGAASGIGRAIARRWVANGGSVVAGDVDDTGLAALVDELGEAVVTAHADVTVEDDVARLVDLAVTHSGGLDAMFNVAGGSRAALLTDLSEQDWRFTIDLCLTSVFFGTKHAARAMTASGNGGAIVNIASLNSRVPMVFGSAYSAAKAGVVSLTQSAAIELGERGIRVNAVSPGLTQTPLVGPMLSLPGAQAAFDAAIPLGRNAEPEDIAAASVFLAGPDAGYITGANLFVDGGWQHTAYPDLRRLL